jgi:hypothetical protein
MLVIPFTLVISAAGAAPRTTYLTTYLRAGPGEEYAAIDEIEPHSQVEVQSCDKDWCRVQSDLAAGYIRADVLAAPDIHVKPGAPPANAPCFTARLNGPPRGGDTVRVCNDK